MSVLELMCDRLPSSNLFCFPSIDTDVSFVFGVYVNVSTSPKLSQISYNQPKILFGTYRYLLYLCKENSMEFDNVGRYLPAYLPTLMEINTATVHKCGYYVSREGEGSFLHIWWNVLVTRVGNFSKIATTWPRERVAEERQYYVKIPRVFSRVIQRSTFPIKTHAP